MAYTFIIFFSGQVGAEILPAWNEEILLQLDELRQEQARQKKVISELAAMLEDLKSRVDDTKSQSISFSSTQVLGNKYAQVAILEISDFECAYCARHAREVFPKLKSEFIDRNLVKYGLSDYPLSSHSGAKEAAVAVRCAGEQNKYWDMYTEIFNDWGKSREVQYKPLVEKLSLDQQRFENCISNPAVMNAVEADISFGNDLGVDGTPRFILGIVENGVFRNPTVIKGARSFETFKEAIVGLLGNKLH